MFSELWSFLKLRCLLIIRHKKKVIHEDPRIFFFFQNVSYGVVVLVCCMNLSVCVCLCVRMYIRVAVT